MANTIGALDVALTANTASFVAGTQKARNELRSFAAQTNTSLARIDKGFTSSSASVGRLAARFATLAIAYRLFRSLTTEAAKESTALTAAISEQEKQWSRLATAAEPAIRSIYSGLASILEVWNDMNAAGQKGVGKMLGVDLRKGGIPFASAANPYASMGKGGNWNPGAAGFPASGMTDITPAAAKAAKEDPLESTRGSLAAGMQDFQLDLAKKQSADIQKVLDADMEYRWDQRQRNIERENAASQSIIDINRQTVEESAEFWDHFNDQQKRLTEERYEMEVMGADRLRMALMDVGTAGLYGFKSLGNAAAQFLEQIAVMIFQMRVLKPIIESIGGAFGTSGGGGGVFNAIAGALTGGFMGSGGLIGGAGTWGGPQAAGGPVSGGTSYLVGERGPELFTPGSSGRISPSGSFGGGGVTINVTLNGSGVAMPDVVAAVAEGVRLSVGASQEISAKQRRSTGRG